MQLQGEFYRTLNLEDLFYPRFTRMTRDGSKLRDHSGSEQNWYIVLYGSVYIRMYSILDYITKLANRN